MVFEYLNLKSHSGYSNFGKCIFYWISYSSIPTTGIKPCLKLMYIILILAQVKLLAGSLILTLSILFILRSVSETVQ